MCFSPFSLAELQAKLLSSETEVKSKLLELDSLKGKLQEASSENTRLLERIKSIEALLEAGRMREAEEDRDLQVLCAFNLGERRRGGCVALWQMWKGSAYAQLAVGGSALSTGPNQLFFAL